MNIDQQLDEILEEVRHQGATKLIKDVDIISFREQIKEVINQHYTYDPELCYRCRKGFIPTAKCDLPDCPYPKAYPI